MPTSIAYLLIDHLGVEMSINFSWEFVSTGVSSPLFGVAVVDKDVIWGAGETVGVVVRTTDGGRSWKNVTPTESKDLMFHDIEAFDHERAVVLAVGEGPASKIFRTRHGGDRWKLVFENPEATAFYDSIAFFDPKHGLALSDPVGNKFRLRATADRGRTWTVAPTDRMPKVQNGEFARATGTSLVAVGPDDAWFGTAPAANTDSRVFRTHDRGRSWKAATVPIPGGEQQFGVASLAFRDRRNGIAVGGGERVSDQPSVAAVTRDGGRTWTRGGQLSGFRLNAAWVPPTKGRTAVAVGPHGSDVTTDGGRTWHQFDQRNLLGVSCAPDGTCWAVGENGMAARLKRRS